MYTYHVIEDKTMPDNSTDITHERILNCSIVLFARSGFHGVSMRQVAVAVGVTVAALYYHFKDKETLYLTAVKHIFNNRLPISAADLREDIDPWQSLGQFIHHFIQTLVADADFQRLLQWVLLDTDSARSQTLTDKVFAPFFAEVTWMINRIAPVQDAHLQAVSMIGLMVFPFESSHVRRFLPGYQLPQQTPEVLTQHIINLLRGGLLGVANENKS